MNVKQIAKDNWKGLSSLVISLISLACVGYQIGRNETLAEGYRKLVLENMVLRSMLVEHGVSPPQPKRPLADPI